jgi:hypothetical protein
MLRGTARRSRRPLHLPGRFRKKWLDTIKSFSSQVENFLKLKRVECSWVSDLAEELAEDRDAEIVGGGAPVKARAGYAAFRGAMPEHPSGEDSVEESLDKRRAEEVLAFIALELDAERFLKGELYSLEAGEGMVFGTGACLTGIRRQEPSYVFRLR